MQKSRPVCGGGFFCFILCNARFRLFSCRYRLKFFCTFLIKTCNIGTHFYVEGRDCMREVNMKKLQTVMKVLAIDDDVTY